MPPPQSPLALRPAMKFLLLLAAMFFTNFVTRVIISPYLVHMEQEFSMSHSQAGGLMFFVSLGIALSMTLSGFVASRISHRSTIILSNTFMAIAMVAISQAFDITSLKAGLFAMGLGAGLYFPSSMSTITSLVAPKDWGKGIAVHELAPNLAFITVPAIAAATEGILTWRDSFAAFGSVALVIGLVYWRWGRGGEFKGEAPSLAVLGEVVSKPAFWVLTWLFTLAVSSSFAPYTMLPLYLVTERGMEVDAANRLLTFSRIASPLVAVATGLVVDRVGAGRTVLISLSASGLLTIGIGLATDGWLTAMVVAQPLLSVCFFPAGLTAASLTFSPGVRNIAMSLIVPSAILIGAGITPALVGWFGDQGDFPMGFVSLGALILTGIPALGLLRFTDRRASKR